MNATHGKRDSYQKRLTSGAERMARRMGSEFVRNDRWETVVKASARGESNSSDRK